MKNSLVSVENSDFIDGTVILSILEHCSEVMWRCIENQKSNSRLACQIEISEEHEDLVVKIPESQY